MRNTATPDDLWIKSHDEFVTTGSADREIYLKVEPPRWKFWARPTFHAMGSYFEKLEYAERERRVKNNPHLYFREEAFVEHMANARGPLRIVANMLTTIYNPKHQIGPGFWLEKVALTSVLVLGTLHWIS